MVLQAICMGALSKAFLFFWYPDQVVNDEKIIPVCFV